MAPRDGFGIAATFVFTFMVILALDRWTAVAEGQPGLFFPLMPEEDVTEEDLISLQEFKMDFAEAAEITELHHEVYRKVGEEQWRTVVRRDLYGRLLKQMIADTGILVPTDEQIVSWAGDNKVKIQEILRSYVPEEGATSTEP